MSWIKTSNTFAGDEKTKFEEEIKKLKVSDSTAKNYLKYILSKRKEWEATSVDYAAVTTKYVAAYNKLVMMMWAGSAVAVGGLAAGGYWWYSKRR